MALANARVYSKHYEAEIQRRRHGVFAHIYDAVNGSLTTVFRIRREKK